jgi:hypothetical protein
VRVVEVDPREEGPILAVVQPTQRGIHHLVAGPLDPGQVQALELRHVEVVVVDAEALVQAPAPVEHERADEGARLVALP